MQTDNARCDFLLNISTNALLATDITGRIIYMNRAAGYFLASEALGSNLAVWSENCASQILAKITNAVRLQQPQSLQLSLRGRCCNLYFYGHQPNCFICIEDITERKQLAASLDKTAQRLEFAERTAHIGYWELDFEHKKIYWSGEMFRIFGASASETSPKKNLIREQMLKEDLPVYKEKLRELIRNGKQVEGQIRIRKRTGGLRYCFFKAGIIDDDGHRKIAGTFQDLTPLIKTQTALEKAKELAENMNRDKSLFLAQASHDLRQPMQALGMFISALAEEKLTDYQKMLLDKIEASADNLKSLLDNLLDLSKLEANTGIGDFSEFNIALLLKKIAGEYQEICRQKKISFRFFSHNAVVFSDQLILERLIRNLLSNAVKYTKSKIILGCKWHKNYLRVMIIDDGAGIHPDEQEQIFDEFYQSRHIANNRSRGSGLGLAIVRKSAEILGIHVKLKSTPEQGSCFWFDIPVLRRLPKIKQKQQN